MDRLVKLLWLLPVAFVMLGVWGAFSLPIYVLAALGSVVVLAIGISAALAFVIWVYALSMRG